MKKVKEGLALALLLAAAASTAGLASPRKPHLGGSEKHPNVVVFMLDDIGWGQLGAYGGPIATPNIDRVAKMGLRYTNFHTAALCSPTRAALLTGRNHHSVGTGVIVELQTSDPGYTSRIPKDKFPLVETLRENGYATGSFGKWHNTPVDQVKEGGPYDLWPQRLGFDRFYGFLAGDTSQWEPTVWDDAAAVEPHVGNANYHFTADMTDKAIKWIDDVHKADADKPFFLYYATGAAHAPHHAPPKYIAKYAGKFDQGWDKVREETLARQKALGLLPRDTQLTPRTADIPAWDELNADEKRLYARMQEVFAGFVEHTDAQFGRLLAALEKSGELENTIIIITSDNGASAEGGLEGSYNEARVFNGLPEDFALNLSKIDELGSRTTFNHYPAGWALAGNTPFKLFKQTTNEGGVRDPFIVAWPAGIAEHGGIRKQFTHVNDVLPTILDVVGMEPLAVVGGVAQQPVEGASFAVTLQDPGAEPSKKVQYFEMLGNRAVYSDGWKAVAFHGRMPWNTAFSNPNFDDDLWHLYKLDADPAENNDLAAKYPAKLAELQKLFHEEAEKYHVYPLDDSTAARVAATYRSFTAGITDFTYHQGDIRLHEALSPPVKNRSHEFKAELVVPEGGADGVIVTAGGRFGGYSFFVKDGKLHYVHNYLGEAQYDVAASEALPAGAVTVRFAFEKTGDGKGVGRLYIGDRQVGEAEIPRVVPGFYSAAETFDVGTDTGSSPSALYDVPFKFNGTIKRLDVILD